MVSQFALNEQNMNAVERVLHYAELPSEGETTTPNDPPPTWPSEGHVSFTNVKLAYREGLPLVLKGVTFDVKPREKVCHFFPPYMQLISDALDRSGLSAVLEQVRHSLKFNCPCPYFNCP